MARRRRRAAQKAGAAAGPGQGGRPAAGAGSLRLPTATSRCSLARRRGAHCAQHISPERWRAFQAVASSCSTPCGGSNNGRRRNASRCKTITTARRGRAHRCASTPTCAPNAQLMPHGQPTMAFSRGKRSIVATDLDVSIGQHSTVNASARTAVGHALELSTWEDSACLSQSKRNTDIV